MVVQRKWMYLESIFIGGDIRSQLPEEARKFDEIDKTFKKVRKIEISSMISRQLIEIRIYQQPCYNKNDE